MCGVCLSMCEEWEEVVSGFMMRETPPCYNVWQVLLLPMRSHNAGLDLKVATHVFLAEPSFFPAKEEQAVARVR